MFLQKINMNEKTQVNRIFQASMFTHPSIPMVKKWKNSIWFPLEFWLLEKFVFKQKFFLTDSENTTKVNRIFSASLLTHLSIPMTKQSNNWIWFFLEIWLVEKVSYKKKFLSPIWRIPQRSIQYFQHHCWLISLFQ